MIVFFNDRHYSVDVINGRRMAFTGTGYINLPESMETAGERYMREMEATMP